MECLVTRLKGSVSDSSLLKIGSIRLELTEGEYSQVASSFSPDNSVLTLLSGNLTLKDSNTGSEIPLPAKLGYTGGFKTMVVGEGGAVVEISNKYSLNNISLLFRALKPTDVAKVGFLTNINGINNGVSATANEADVKGLVGDISDIKGFDSIEQIIWANPLCTGDIEGFSRFPLLTYIQIFRSNVYGSIESLVRGYRTNGRTSGQIAFGYMPKNVTFNGASAESNENRSLSWTNDTITFGGVTITA